LNNKYREPLQNKVLFIVFILTLIQYLLSFINLSVNESTFLLLILSITGIFAIYNFTIKRFYRYRENKQLKIEVKKAEEELTKAKEKVKDIKEKKV